MIGIFIGIFSIVALIGLGEGLRTAVMSQFGMFAPDVISISPGSMNGPPGTGGASPFPNNYINKIKNLKEIKRVAGRNLAFSRIVYDNHLKLNPVTSIPNGESRKLVYYSLNLKANEGRLLKDHDTGKVVIGKKLAEDKKFSKVIKVGSNILINNKKFEVIGILKSSGNFMLDKIIFMNEHDFYNLYPEDKNTYSFIVAQYNTIYSVKEVSDSISKLLRKERNVKKGNEDFEIKTPQSVINNLNSTLFAVQLFVYIIAAISILVGGIGIMTTMYTTVLERTREIGIMKSIGATNKIIFILFLIESGFIGFTGGLIGTTLGIITAQILSAVGRFALGTNLIQANISLALILFSLIFSFLLGSFFGTFPAIRASRLKPVDALSYVK